MIYNRPKTAAQGDGVPNGRNGFFIRKNLYAPGRDKSVCANVLLLFHSELYLNNSEF